MATFVVKVDWLNAVTSVQTTAAEDVKGTSKYGLQVSSTGNPDAVAVVLEGSIDGVHWQSMVSGVLNATLTTNLVWAVDKPVKLIRLNFNNLSGGTSPTVSASAIAVD